MLSVLETDLSAKSTLYVLPMFISVFSNFCVRFHDCKRIFAFICLNSYGIRRIDLKENLIIRFETVISHQ